MTLKLDKRSVRKYALVTVTCLTLLLWATWHASARTITGNELIVFRYINNWPELLSSVFLLITQLGSAWMLFAVTLLLLWKKLNRLALRVFFGGVIAYLITEFLKQLVARPRPFELLPGVHLHEYFVTGYGFPSGHTALATIVSLIIVASLPKRWRWLPVVWVVPVGVSRVYLGVHAPLDVVAGCMIGTLVFIASQAIGRKLKTVTKITNLSMTK